MAFLQQQGQPGPPGQSQPVPEQGAPGPDGRESTLGSEQSTAEEQDHYERVVLAGDEIIFGDGKAREAVVKQLKLNADQPAQGLADATSMLVVNIDEQSGNQVPETVILPAATELLEHMADLAESLKMFAIDDAVVNRAGQIMIQNLGDAYGATPEDIQAMMDSVAPEEAERLALEQDNYAKKQPPKGVA